MSAVTAPQGARHEPFAIAWYSNESVSLTSNPRIHVAAIHFLNPAPLMWDFEHPPLNASLALRYQIDRMSPSECAARLAAGQAGIGLIPIAALATTPGLRILPGCTIASKGRVRSLLLVRRASQPLASLRSVAAETASRTTIVYARILFHKWDNPDVPFLPMAAELDTMLDNADAAILIGDPALLALEERANRFERTDEELVYHDLAEEWHEVTGLPFVSAVWGVAPQDSSGVPGLDLETWDFIVNDFIRSRDHGLENIDALVAEWSAQLPIPEQTIRSYLATNIHYVLDEECLEGMRGFFRMAAELGILPEYTLSPTQFAT
jgi:chorismate dehydratase